MGKGAVRLISGSFFVFNKINLKKDYLRDVKNLFKFDSLIMNLDLILDVIYELPEQSKEKLKHGISEITYPKGELLLKANKVERNIYFIRAGLVRAFTEMEDKEITFWFGKEGDTVVSMKSYIYNQKGYENIELLEQSSMFKLDTMHLQKLYTQDIHIANWGRKFAEKELIKTEERLISHQLRTASQRYQDLLSNRPELLQRVQLGYIASYLGITQVSLSRIRGELR